MDSEKRRGQVAADDGPKADVILELLLERKLELRRSRQRRRWRRLREEAKIQSGRQLAKTSKNATCLKPSAVFLLLLQALLELAQTPPIARASSAGLADFDGATFYKAPVGSRVRIACNGSHWSDESVSLVLWFKGAAGAANSVPIYTVDARQRPLSQGARHLVADEYKGRARFNAQAQPPYLDLNPLEADDQAEYRCRIDYRSKPRENFLVILFVLVPPQQVQIMDASGRSLEQIYGPLGERSDLTLLCLSKGGRPAPALRWRRDRKVIDDSYLTINDYLALRRAGRLLSATSAADAPDLDRQNSSSSQNSSSRRQLESLWADWRRWPEHELFASELAIETQPQTSGAQWAGSGAASSPELPRTEEPVEEPLLSLQVDPNATTAANSLRLTNLPASLGAEANWKLECEASNLHYDLRALIKLFAPPSLAPTTTRDLQRDAKASLRAGQRRLPDSGTPESPGNENKIQLVSAIERALEAALSSELLVTATALRQIKTDNSSSSSLLKEPLMSFNPANANKLAGDDEHDERQVEWRAHLLHTELLKRPHQLAYANQAEAISSGEGSAGVSAGGQQMVRSRLIALDIYLRPQDVRITSPSGQRPLSAGQLTEFTCQSSGSRPAARLTWLRQRRPLEPKLQRQLELNPNSSSSPQNLRSQSLSKLSIRLEPSDHGKELTCRSENEQLGKLKSEDASQPGLLEDTRILNVQYAPRLKLELGNAKLSMEIREGQDIFFVCHSDANPPARDITWLHDERPLNASSESSQETTLGDPRGEGRPIMSNNSLVLQRVRVEQRGRYACVASNSEGISESNQLELRVLHAPRCEQAELQTRQVPLRSSVHLHCPMRAEPPAAELRWRLETESVGPGGAPSAALSTSRTLLGEGPSSQLEYRVETALDYGRLRCEARNLLGEQSRACLYDIVPPPTPASATLHCLALNVTSQAVGVACPSGLASGQTLEIELRSQTASSGATEAKLRAGPLEEPYFAVGNLQPATNYTMLVSLNDGEQNSYRASFNFSTSASDSYLEQSTVADQPQVEPFPEGSRPSLEALISTRSAGFGGQHQDLGERPASNIKRGAKTVAEPAWWQSVLDTGAQVLGFARPPLAPQMVDNSSVGLHKTARRPPINKLMDTSGPSTRLLITSGLLLALLACSLMLLLLARRRWRRQRAHWKRCSSLGGSDTKQRSQSACDLRAANGKLAAGNNDQPRRGSFHDRAIGSPDHLRCFGAAQTDASELANQSIGHNSNSNSNSSNNNNADTMELPVLGESQVTSQTLDRNLLGRQWTYNNSQPSDWPSLRANVSKSRSSLCFEPPALVGLRPPDQMHPAPNDKAMTLLGARLISDADLQLASECQRQQLPSQQLASCNNNYVADHHFDQASNYDTYTGASPLLFDNSPPAQMIGGRAVASDLHQFRLMQDAGSLTLASDDASSDSNQKFCTWTQLDQAKVSGDLENYQSGGQQQHPLFIQLYQHQQPNQLEQESAINGLNFAHLNIVAEPYATHQFHPLSLNSANSFHRQQQQTANRRQPVANSLKCPSLTSSASIGSSSAGFGGGGGGGGCGNNKDQSPLSLTNTTLSNNTTESLLLNTCRVAEVEAELELERSTNNPNGSLSLATTEPTLKRQRHHVVYAKPQTQSRSHNHHHQQHHQQHMGAPASKSILKNRLQQRVAAIEPRGCNCDKEIDNDEDQDKAACNNEP